MKVKPSGSRQVDEEIPSPCSGACRMENGVCIGCYRTMDEIIGWIGASNDKKRAILAAAAERRRRLDAGAGPQPEPEDR